MAWCKDGCVVPDRRAWVLIGIMGLCVFSNQAFFITGDKLAGPIISSAWRLGAKAKFHISRQCSQPVFTLLISLCLGWESITWRKSLGIVLSFSSGAFLVSYGQELQSPTAIGKLGVFIYYCYYCYISYI